MMKTVTTRTIRYSIPLLLSCFLLCSCASVGTYHLQTYTGARRSKSEIAVLKTTFSLAWDVQLLSIDNEDPHTHNPHLMVWDFAYDLLPGPHVIKLSVGWTGPDSRYNQYMKKTVYHSLQFDAKAGHQYGINSDEIKDLGQNWNQYRILSQE